MPSVRRPSHNTVQLVFLSTRFKTRFPTMQRTYQNIIDVATPLANDPAWLRARFLPRFSLTRAICSLKNEGRPHDSMHGLRDSKSGRHLEREKERKKHTHRRLPLERSWNVRDGGVAMATAVACGRRSEKWPDLIGNDAGHVWIPRNRTQGRRRRKVGGMWDFRFLLPTPKEAAFSESAAWRH